LRQKNYPKAISSDSTATNGFGKNSTTIKPIQQK